MTEPGDGRAASAPTEVATPAERFDLTGRVALVTGGSRGLGRAMVLGMAAAGADVVIASRKIDACRALAEHVTASTGRRALPVACHVGRWPDLEALVDAAYDRFGRIDVLVNNGVYQGAVQTQEFLDADEDDLRRVFEGNVLAQLTLTRAALPHMFEQGGGTVVNMISAVAYTDPPGRIGEGGWGMSHAMSKAAFARVAPMLQLELGDRGLRFFSVDPGFVVTEKTEAIGAAEQYARHFRPATPPVIGAVVAWLAADPESDALLGQVVFAQRECKQRGLLPGWPPPKV
jgi:hypothetical protein